MNDIALAYCSAPFEAVTAYNEDFDSILASGVTGEQKLFSPVQLFNPEIHKSEIKVETMRGRKFNHYRYKHQYYSIVISSNDLDSNGLEFIYSFFAGDYKYIVVFDDTGAGNYVEIIWDSDKLTPEYIDGIKYLPEITLNVYTAEAV